VVLLEMPREPSGRGINDLSPLFSGDEEGRYAGTWIVPAGTDRLEPARTSNLSAAFTAQAHNEHEIIKG
jgi:hypothetical protein